MADVFNNAFPQTGGGSCPVLGGSGNDFGIIKSMRKQYAWLFRVTGMDAYGKQQYGAPSLIQVRWDDFVDAKVSQASRIVDARATVYVDQRVSVGDILMREEGTGEVAPAADEDFRIRDYKEYPNLRNTAQLRIAIL
jgi:hypothetical protein